MNRNLSAAAAIALLSVGACTQLADTPELRLEKAREVAQLEVENGALDDALNLGADIAMAASLDALTGELGRVVTAEEQSRVRSIFRQALAEFLTPAELDDLARFYRSPAGTKILSLQAELTADLGDAAEQIVVENEMAFAEAIDAALAEQFPELAQGSGR